MVNEEISAWDIMFWRGVSNPQSGEKYDYSNETYTKYDYSNETYTL